MVTHTHMLTNGARPALQEEAAPPVDVRAIYDQFAKDERAFLELLGLAASGMAGGTQED